jgi:hypothetical protein
MDTLAGSHCSGSWLRTGPCPGALAIAEGPPRGPDSCCDGRLRERRARRPAADADRPAGVAPALPGQRVEDLIDDLEMLVEDVQAARVAPGTALSVIRGGR